MTATAYNFGHMSWYDWDLPGWRYSDDDTSVRDNDRPCPECGELETPEGYDPCIGCISGATAACCGHGLYEGSVRMKDGPLLSLGWVGDEQPPARSLDIGLVTVKEKPGPMVDTSGSAANDDQNEVIS